MHRSFKVGDLVKTPDGHMGLIDEIDKNPWRDRGDRIWKLHRYHVPSPRSGSPIVWWLARQLEAVRHV